MSHKGNDAYLEALQTTEYHYFDIPEPYFTPINNYLNRVLSEATFDNFTNTLSFTIEEWYTKVKKLEKILDEEVGTELVLAYLDSKSDRKV